MIVGTSIRSRTFSLAMSARPSTRITTPVMVEMFKPAKSSGVPDKSGINGIVKFAQIAMRMPHITMIHPMFANIFRFPWWPFSITAALRTPQSLARVICSIPIQIDNTSSCGICDTCSAAATPCSAAPDPPTLMWRESQNGSHGSEKPKISAKKIPKNMLLILQLRNIAINCIPASLPLTRERRPKDITRRTVPYPTSPRISPNIIGNTMAISNDGSSSVYLGRE